MDALAFICFMCLLHRFNARPLVVTGLIASRQSTKGVSLVDCKRKLFRQSKIKLTTQLELTVMAQ